MKKTNKYSGAVIGIVILAKKYNSEIGSYIEHFENDDFKYEVALTDKGAITISIELAQDFATNPTNINETRIIKVANSFRKIN